MKKILNRILILAMLALLLGAGWGGQKWGSSEYGSQKYGIGEWGLGETFSDYNFYVEFPNVTDRVSGEDMATTLTAGRFSYDGTEYGEDEPVFESDGNLLSNGAYIQLVPKSESTADWTGTGPWTQSINLTNTDTYTVSTNLNGATVTITAGTATIDAGASATFGNPDQFVVSGAGTVTISTDTADPKAQLTQSPYVLPYAVNTGSGSLAVPLNYSDADEGNKWTIDGTDTPQLLGALGGFADGVELVTNGSDWTGATGATPTTGWFVYNAGIFTIMADSGPAGVGDSALKIEVDATPTSFPGQRFLFTTEVGKMYNFDSYHKHGTATSGAIRVGTTIGGVDLLSYANLTDAAWTQHTDYFVATTTTTHVTLISISSTIGQFELFDEVSIQAVDTAKGSLIVEWTPRFNAADVSGVVNILTPNNETGSMLFYNGATQEIHAHDGTNTAVVAYVPVNGTPVEIKLDYGENPTPEMQLSADGTPGTAVTFAGAFPVSTDLSIGWEADEPQWIKHISFAKEPSWDLLAGISVLREDGTIATREDGTTWYKE